MQHDVEGGAQQGQRVVDLDHVQRDARVQSRFCVLTPTERGQAPTPEPPRYDLSWVLDSPLAQGPPPH